MFQLILVTTNWCLANTAILKDPNITIVMAQQNNHELQRNMFLYLV